MQNASSADVHKHSEVHWTNTSSIFDSCTELWPYNVVIKFHSLFRRGCTSCLAPYLHTALRFHARWIQTLPLHPYRPIASGHQFRVRIRKITPNSSTPTPPISPVFCDDQAGTTLTNIILWSLFPTKNQRIQATQLSPMSRACAILRSWNTLAPISVSNMSVSSNTRRAASKSATASSNSFPLAWSQQSSLNSNTSLAGKTWNHTRIQKIQYLYGPIWRYSLV